MMLSYCRLFLATPFQFNPQDVETALKGALAGGDVASLLIRHEDAGQLETAARLLTPIAQKAGVAVVIEADAALAKACGADGVEISGGTEDYSKARAVLGTDFIVGGRCGADRHNAMALGEAGADYVCFSHAHTEGDRESESIWWAKLFEVPCVEENVSSPSDGRVFAAQSVDFIRPDVSLWAGADAAQKTVEMYNAMIGETHIADG